MKWKYKKQVALGYDDQGNRLRAWVYGNTLAELNNSINEAKKAVTRNPSEVTFGRYAQKWLETYKANKSTNTTAMYRSAVDKCAHIRALKMKDIRKTDLQMIINSNYTMPRTCQKIALTLKQIFSAAVEDGIIDSSPAEKLEIPAYKAKEKRSLTNTEREAVKTAELADRDRLFLDLLYYCGLRRGEALALTRSDFDFKHLLLCVNKSIAFDKNTPIMKDTKTHVTRYVPIPEQKAKEWKSILSDMSFDVFEKPTLSCVRRMWERIQKAINVKMCGTCNISVLHLTPHMVRHDYATRLYYVPGISTKKKAEILGHSERLFTELYSHLDDERENMKQFQNAMNW